MRAIDADAFYKDICDSLNEMTRIGIAVDGEWLWGKLNDSLENAPTIEPKPHWILCSERLPEKSGKYYVSGGDKVWICEFLIIPNFTGGWCDDVANPEIQAWMPYKIPEPYKEIE